MAEKIRSHRDLEVYQRAFAAAMKVFKLSKTFPKDETYSLTDQVRKSSRSICANLAEAWRKRRYELAFISKLSDAETEAGETQTWIEFAVSCEYIEAAQARAIYAEYNRIIAMIVSMIARPDSWLLRKRSA